jgi:superfamily II DNA or RNA helicase
MNKIKGDAYELYCQDYVKSVLKYDCYTWNESMLIDNIIIKVKLAIDNEDLRIKRKNKKNVFKDNGIDLIAVHNDCIIAIQCKCGYVNGLYVSDLAGFFMMIANYTFNKHIVFYTSKLSRVIVDMNKIVDYIPLKYNNEILTIENIVNDISNNNDENNNIQGFKNKMQLSIDSIIIKDPIISRDYQLNCKQAVIDSWLTIDNAIISMPCGTGKTFVSYLVSREFKKIVFFSPLRQFAISCMDEYIKYGYSANDCMLVSTDGCRDNIELKKFTEKDNWLLFVCYKSTDVVCDIILNDPSIIVIIDEMHNLSERNVYENDDDEDEDYMYQILNSENKCLLMSATPKLYIYDDIGEESDIGEIVYKMEFKEALDRDIIVDYTILIPNVSVNGCETDIDLIVKDIKKECCINEMQNTDIYARCIFYVMCMRQNRCKRTIFYCTDTKEVELYKEILLKVMKDYNYYENFNIQSISAKTNGKIRQKILYDFENYNGISILLSMKIMNECINVIKCDSIYVTHVTSNICTFIQRMCRSVRKDKTNINKIANIMVWCDENNEMIHLVQGLKEYDLNFDKRGIGNKIKIVTERINSNISSSNNDIDINMEIIGKYIIGVTEFRSINWYEKLDAAIRYIDEFDKRPGDKSKDKDIKTLGNWMSKQRKNYKKKIQIMSNSEIYDRWTEFIDTYKKHFISRDEDWYNSLSKSIRYIDEFDKRPSDKSKDKDIKTLGKWMDRQQTNYKKKIKIMSNSEIYDRWTEFIDKYKKHFLSKDEDWYNSLSKSIEYIDEFDKRPSSKSKDKDIKTLGKWMSNQQTNYKKKTEIMSNSEIYDRWTEFIDKYKKHFLSKDEDWYNSLSKLIRYIDEFDKRPSQKSKDKNIKTLGDWISKQQTNYKKKIQIMTNSEIYDRWTEFINNHSKYFK